MPETNTTLPPAVDENYANFIFNYNSSPSYLAYLKQNYQVSVINSTYAIIYVPLDGFELLSPNSYSYGSIPKCYAPMDVESMNASGITRIHNQPYIPLTGNGVAVAIIDSGIDYTNPLFRNSDGTTRIARIWDQTIQSSNPPADFSYGTEYTREDINFALSSEIPLEQVPSTDTDGHGTFISGIVAGNEDIENRFIGAAFDATLIVVKLKPAKKYLRDLFLISENAIAYQEDDIMAALTYARLAAFQLNDIPLSICLPLGTNSGAHLGISPLAIYCNDINRLFHTVLSVAAGNEGNARHHYYADLEPSNEFHTIEINVSSQEQGFSLELWGSSPTSHDLIIQSPSGETQEVFLTPPYSSQTLEFIFINTTIYVNFLLIENQSGKQLIFFRFLSPAPGLWKFQIRNNNPYKTSVQMWLPVTSFLIGDTYFLRPSPYMTVTEPGNGDDIICVTAYDYRNDSIYLNSSRGFSADNNIVPTLAAPGVNIRGPVPGGNYTTRSGTSIAAAHTCGACALFLQWAVVLKNVPFINGIGVKNYLIRGTRRSSPLEYPNPEWGYGILDLYNVFESLTTI